MLLMPALDFGFFIVAHFLGDVQLLGRDGEVSVGYGGLLHPDVAQGHTVQGDLAHAVHHKLGHVALGIVEEGAVAVLHELQGFEPAVGLDLDLKARAHQGIAGGGIDLLEKKQLQLWQ